MTTPTQPSASQGLLGFLKGLMSIITDDNGKISLPKFLVCMIIIAMSVLWVKWDSVTETIQTFNREQSYDAYLTAIQDERNRAFDAAVENQSRLVYSIINPELVGVFIYKPEDIHHFKEMIHYEGKLPEGSTPQDFKQLGVDKTSKEYTDHIKGFPFQSKGLEKSKSSITNTEFYTYSCPIFNSKGVYSGFIGMYWQEVPVDLNKEQYFMLCTQAARSIGINLGPVSVVRK